MTSAEIAAEIERLMSEHDAAEEQRSDSSNPTEWAEAQEKMAAARMAAGTFLLFQRENSAIILAALREPDEAAVERAAVVIARRMGVGFANLDPEVQAEYREDALAAIRAARAG